MTDIVERLRKATLYTGGGETESALPEEAADEIERLRELTANVPDLVAEIETLRDELDTHWKRLTDEAAEERDQP